MPSCSSWGNPTAAIDDDHVILSFETEHVPTDLGEAAEEDQANRRLMC